MRPRPCAPHPSVIRDTTPGCGPTTMGESSARERTVQWLNDVVGWGEDSGLSSPAKHRPFKRHPWSTKVTPSMEEKHKKRRHGKRARPRATRPEAVVTQPSSHRREKHGRGKSLRDPPRPSSRPARNPLLLSWPRRVKEPTLRTRRLLGGGPAPPAAPRVRRMTTCRPMTSAPPPRVNLCKQWCRSRNAPLNLSATRLVLARPGNRRAPRQPRPGGLPRVGKPRVFHVKHRQRLTAARAPGALRDVDGGTWCRPSVAPRP